MRSFLGDLPILQAKENNEHDANKNSQAQTPDKVLLAETLLLFLARRLDWVESSVARVNILRPLVDHFYLPFIFEERFGQVYWALLYYFSRLTPSSI